MADFKKIRIIEAGPTKNSWTDPVGDPKDDCLKTGNLVITLESLPSLVECGNKRPIHSRRTHNGLDLLDDYVGYFTNFVQEDNVVYADFTFSEAAKKANPDLVVYIRTLIEKEPEMLGISVVDLDVKIWNEEKQTFDVTLFEELIAADLVGLPAATSSLFSNNKSKNSTFMGFWTNLKSSFAAKEETKCAEEIVETVEGKKLTIKATGDEAAVGDEIVKEDGSPVEDGEVIVDLGEEGKIIIVVKDGKIAEFKEFIEEADTDKETKTPDEFSKRLDALEASISKLSAALNKHTKTPITQQNTKATDKDKGSKATEVTQLSVEEKRAKAKEAMEKYAKM